MSDGEIALLVVSSLLLLVVWGVWYAEAAKLRLRGVATEGRLVIRTVPLVCAGLIWIVLRTLASHDVQDDWRYLAMYTALGLAWVGVAIRLTTFTGLSMRDDVLERGNGAAAIGIGGAMLGISLAFAGGNIGDGPGWWVVVFAAGLSTLGLFAMWLALDGFGGVNDSVTIERDRASALRLAGFLSAEGIILGRAVAGDWVSAAATLRDFAAYATPGLVLLFVAIVIERWTRPTAEQPAPSAVTHGVFPALLYLLIALGHLALVGLGS